MDTSTAPATGTCIVCGGTTTHRSAAGFHHPLADMATCDAIRAELVAAQHAIDAAAFLAAHPRLAR